MYLNGNVCEMQPDDRHRRPTSAPLADLEGRGREHHRSLPHRLLLVFRIRMDSEPL